MEKQTGEPQKMQGKEVETGKRGDIESGTLYPGMTENPALRWSFIRKVYLIITAQLLFTTLMSAVFVFVRPIPEFILSQTPGAWAAYVSVLVSPFIVLALLLIFRKRHPVNVILLAAYTLCISASVGIVCGVSTGKVILEAAILTTSVVVGLTLYTFWAAKRGHDYMFLGPFLLASALILLVYLSIQIFFPLEKASMTIYGCLATIVYSGFLIFYTGILIKQFTYDQYIEAAVSLYLVVINLFMSLVMGFTVVQ